MHGFDSGFKDKRQEEATRWGRSEKREQGDSSNPVRHQDPRIIPEPARIPPKRAGAPDTAAPQAASPPLGAIASGIVLNAVVPVILYKLSKRYCSPSEFTALVMAALFPLGKSAFDLLRHRQFDPISIVVLLGITTDGAALLFGGSPRLLLVRESMFTGAFGVACFASLLLPRPMMFYFSRYFIAGTDPERQARFNAAWQFPEVRVCHRLITIVWGCVFVGELIIRLVLIYRLPAALVLIISPVLLGVLTIVTMVWSFRYGHQVRLRALARFNQLDNQTGVVFSNSG